jgi:hypothetical protein
MNKNNIHLHPKKSSRLKQALAMIVECVHLHPPQRMGAQELLFYYIIEAAQGASCFYSGITTIKEDRLLRDKKCGYFFRRKVWTPR